MKKEDLLPVKAEVKNSNQLIYSHLKQNTMAEKESGQQGKGSQGGQSGSQSGSKSGSQKGGSGSSRKSSGKEDEKRGSSSGKSGSNK